jgi:hypothetical protein
MKTFIAFFACILFALFFFGWAFIASDCEEQLSALAMGLTCLTLGRAVEFLTS